MLRRWRDTARVRAQRAMTVLLDEHESRRQADAGRLDEAVARVHDEVLALAAEVRVVLGDLAGELEAAEQRRRRDLGYALDRWATATTADLIAREMATAQTFDHPHDTLRWALTQAPADGLTLEFGVASGTTLGIIAPTRPRGSVYGFDSFAGLPERWRTGFDEGIFAAGDVPEVSGAELVVGWFEDTLPGFVAEHPEPVAFLHLDADLYSSTKTVLDHLGDRLVPGSIVVFDEYFNYPGWPDHEHRAWRELVERTGLRFQYEAYTRDNEQVVVRVLGESDVAG